MASSSMAEHEAKGDVPPYPDTKVTLAFGNDTFPVLVKQLTTSDSVEVLQSALRASCRLLPTALNAVKAVSAGAIPAFSALCTSHADTLVRQRASKALEIALRNGSAKRSFHAEGLLVPFKAAIVDKNDDVRENSLRALLELGSAAPGPDAMQEAGYVPLLVQRSKEDPAPHTKALVLQVLKKVVVTGGPGQREAVATPDAIEATVSLLKHDDAGVREAAAAVMGQLTFSTEGKTLAVSLGAVPALATVMGIDPSSAVKAEAAGAAMSIVVDNAGKEAFLRVGLEPLADLLSDRSRMVRLNITRTLAALAAHPSARAQLKDLGTVDVLKTLLADVDEGSLDHGVYSRALEALQWVP